ncbi:mitochondrial glycoprotein [Powellomyces hirtus]|nr:mitochondrial glycoprotein [Powellomyces hirtus]
MFRAASRPLFTLRPLARVATLTPLRAAAMPTRSFSVSAFSRMSAGATDVELHSTLVRELKHEQQQQSSEGAVPEFLAEFKARKPEWTILDQPLHKEVALTRTFGNEKITVLFNTDALDEAEEFENELEEGEEEDRTLPVPVSIIIEKPASPTLGALEISASIQDGGFFIESVDHTATPALAHDQTAEGDWTRRSKYAGPFFGNLDEGLQEQFHTFLAERDLGDEVVDFVPLYVEYKEQREYQTWLENVASFVKN